MRRKIRLLAFLPAIVLMITIFCFSAQNGNESAKVSGVTIISAVNRIFELNMSRKMIIKEAGNMQFVVRKAAHMAEYACLAGLVLFGLSVNLEKKKYLYPLSLGAAALYASTDEIHQLFTPGRSGEVRDVIIDTCGALIGLLVIRFVVSLRNRRQARGVDLT